MISNVAYPGCDVRRRPPAPPPPLPPPLPPPRAVGLGWAAQVPHLIM
eukprot:SAG11_NODE_2746_length_3014_cov_3.898799_1_plen_46_part_10